MKTRSTTSEIIGLEGDWFKTWRAIMTTSWNFRLTGKAFILWRREPFGVVYRIQCKRKQKFKVVVVDCQKKYYGRNNFLVRDEQAYGGDSVRLMWHRNMHIILCDAYLVSVSYTHLDVYKRQTYYPATKFDHFNKILFLLKLSITFFFKLSFVILIMICK